MSASQSVLILGAGVNGVSLARELTLNRVPVVLVDTADIASGASSKSSHLIHGGLRYLEYGEFDLVREALAERTRLLQHAPQYVRPLELFIPVRNRAGGLWTTLRRFLGVGGGRAVPRGQWLVRLGLWFYDTYARDKSLPKRRIYHADDPQAAPVDSSYRWECSYHDGFVRLPERFILALLEDARRIALEQGVELRVLNYHRAELAGREVTIFPTSRFLDTATPVAKFQPAAIVNATGAWVDETLQQLHVPSRQLMGGTKGSHLVTFHPGLRDALAGRGVYAEAHDDRPVFLLPLGDATLVGTTDVPFVESPEHAVATPDEIGYLIETVNTVLRDIRLSAEDIDWTFSGVRPLPHSHAATPGAVTRRHSLERNDACEVPLYSVVGGKLTTCRSLAEEAAGVILERLGVPQTANTRDRVVPGGEDYPPDDERQATLARGLAQRFSLTPEQIADVWALLGTRAEGVLQECGDARQPLAGALAPRALASWMIEHEWVHTLEDLVCRRLMLLYRRDLSRQTLAELADALVASGRLPATAVADEIDRVVDFLRVHFGKQVE